MNLLKPLIMMQLKDKIDLSFLKSKKKTIFKVVFFLLGIISITAIIYLLFMVSKMLHLFSMISIIPSSVMVVIVAIMLILSIISCTYGLMKTLYFSPDNPILLTLPVVPNLVFVSKIIVFYIYELIKNLFFLFPVFIAYGLISGYSIVFYLWIIFCSFFVAAIPVIIASLLSIPAMWIAQILKQHKWFQITIITIVIAVVVLGIFKGIAAIPENINIVGSGGYIANKIQDFLKSFSKIFIPFTWLTNMLVGKRLGLVLNLFNINTLYVFLGVLGILVIIFGLSFMLAKPLFLKMASKPFEYKKVLVKHAKKNHTKKPFRSSLRIELLQNVRSSEILYTTLAVFFALPIAIFFFNKLLSAMDTALLGQQMTYSFNILIILLIILTYNALLASVYSKEGLAGLHSKSRPINHQTKLMSKLIWNFVFSSLSAIFAIIIFQTIMHLESNNLMLFILMILFVNGGIILWSGEIDFINPLYQQYTTFGVSANNPNETKSTIMSFIVAFAFFGLSLFLFTENYRIAWIKLAGLGLVFFASRLYLFITKANVYYKEKV